MVNIMNYSIELNGKFLKTVEASSISHVCADLEEAHPELTDPKGEEFTIVKNGTDEESAFNGYYSVERA